MGVNGRAGVAVLLVIVFLGSMWLQGNLQDFWRPCPKEHTQIQTPGGLNTSDDGSGEEAIDDLFLRECPGQDFQVSQLVSHLRAALDPGTDVLMQPYLSSWDELIKFLNALGPMVGLISQEIKDKTGLIRELAQQDMESRGGCDQGARCLGSGAPTRGLQTDEGSYHSVRSMITAELQSGLVDFHQLTSSGCRTLLRLHRALLWLRLFLQKLGESPPPGGRARSPSDLCREAYQESLSRHHTWLVRRAVELAFIAIPDRTYFFRLVCVQNQQGATLVLNKVVRAITEVYARTEVALEEHGMLDLP
uniref:Glycolipid transfer protein domain containing 2b n=1 Tax=Paramormyrops kingsleyae TaxID=1676925 RepID=A0A3B3RQY6_9TELE|nr:ceramide-1-phosphate transfer protein-like [Paramormyrops kingsleyae]